VYIRVFDHFWIRANDPHSQEIVLE